MCCLCEVLWLSEQTPSLWCVVYVKFCGWANKHRVCDVLFMWSFVAERTNIESVTCCLCKVLWLSEQTSSLWCVVYVKFCGWANKHRVRHTVNDALHLRRCHANHSGHAFVIHVTLMIISCLCVVPASRHWQSTPGASTILSLLFTRLVLTVQTAEHHCPLISTKLYRLMRTARVSEQLTYSR